MINFPSNPTLNQVYTYNNKSWEWNGTIWAPQQDGGLRTHTVTLTTQDLLDLDVTPFEIVPAAGEGTYIAVVSLVAIAKSPTVALSQSGYATLQYFDDYTDDYSIITSSFPLTDTGVDAFLVDGTTKVSSIIGYQGSSRDFSTRNNKSVMLVAFTPLTDPGGADTTMLVSTKYVVHDISWGL